MNHTFSFDRPTFDEIVADIRQIFPVNDEPEFELTPDSIHNYFAKGGVQLLWQPIPDWESYERGHRDISEEDFIDLLFSPKFPGSDEKVIAVTDECFDDHQGFSFLFGELLHFARNVYPEIVSRPMDFFQPLDTIFVAKSSRLIVMLHHEGHRTQFAG